LLGLFNPEDGRDVPSKCRLTFNSYKRYILQETTLQSLLKYKPLFKHFGKSFSKSVHMSGVASCGWRGIDKKETGYPGYL
jgi:hypothetical protein